MRRLGARRTGIGFARALTVLHLEDIGPSAPRLPGSRWASLVQVVASAAVHLAVGLAIVSIVKPGLGRKTEAPPSAVGVEAPIDIRHIVFIARESVVGGGGGGGGNRQAGPIRHAQGIGSDNITLRVRKPAKTADVVTDVEPLPALVLDAKPLLSGTFDQIGLPTGGVSYGTSTGPGSGGGVGTGVGTGIGSGRGPGLGPGSGGGTGGGAYRPGGAVSAPRVLVQVRPSYTAEAMSSRIQGTVALELVVTRDGLPSQIRVIRSLDPRGLDQEAINAAAQWRFEPGRLAGVAVDVLVVILLDFSIR
jgi:TonB family protein